MCSTLLIPLGRGLLYDSTSPSAFSFSIQRKFLKKQSAYKCVLGMLFFSKSLYKSITSIQNRNFGIENKTNRSLVLKDTVADRLYVLCSMIDASVDYWCLNIQCMCPSDTTLTKIRMLQLGEGLFDIHLLSTNQLWLKLFFPWRGIMLEIRLPSIFRCLCL